MGWWEGGVGAVEGVEQGGKVVGGGGWPDVPVQAGEHYHLPFLGGETCMRKTEAAVAKVSLLTLQEEEMRRAEENS